MGFSLYSPKGFASKTKGAFLSSIALEITEYLVTGSGHPSCLYTSPAQVLAGVYVDSQREEMQIIATITTLNLKRLLELKTWQMYEERTHQKPHAAVYSLHRTLKKEDQHPSISE